MLDRLLTGQNPEWLYPFLSVLIALAVIQITVAWVQAVYSLKINGKVADAVGLTAAFPTHSRSDAGNRYRRNENSRSSMRSGC